MIARNCVDRFDCISSKSSLHTPGDASRLAQRSQMAFWMHSNGFLKFIWDVHLDVCSKPISCTETQRSKQSCNGDRSLWKIFVCDQSLQPCDSSILYLKSIFLDNPRCKLVKYPEMCLRNILKRNEDFELLMYRIYFEFNCSSLVSIVHELLDDQELSWVLLQISNWSFSDFPVCNWLDLKVFPWKFESRICANINIRRSHFHCSIWSEAPLCITSCNVFKMNERLGQSEENHLRGLSELASFCPFGHCANEVGR